MADVPLRIEGDVARHYMARMRRFKKTAEIDAVQIARPFIVVQTGDVPITGEMHAIAGSYLARSAEGTLYPIPEKVFRSSYQEVEDGG